MTPRVAPAERVRRRVAASVGEEVARQLPSGYERLGRVLVLRLPEAIRPAFLSIGEAWVEESGVTTVLRRAGPVAGEWRLPQLERIAGDTSETEVVEHGVRYRFDASRIMFARGNRAERRRAGILTRLGENVVDLFAGIGYFAIPSARLGHPAHVLAVEQNPLAYDYLVQNIELNGVGRTVRPVLGDNRSVPLPRGEADRVFLGYLPTSLPWVPTALALLRPAGGNLHLHLIAGARQSLEETEESARAAVSAADGRVNSAAGRVVKAYGPGRVHVVVDVDVVPPRITP